MIGVARKLGQTELPERKRIGMKSHTEYLTLNLPARMAFENITPKVEEIVRNSGVAEGLVLCNAMHITASVFINDNEPGLHEDYKRWLEGAFGCTISELYGADRHNYGLDDLSRLGFERVKWAAALRHEANSGGARPEMMDKVKKLAAGKMEKLTALLRRIGAEDGYPCRHAETGEYDVDNVVSTDWLIDQIVYRIYGLTEDEIKMVEETG